MATLALQKMQDVMDWYDDFMLHNRDPRVDGWLLMDSPLPTLLLCLTYMYVVKVLGPSYMKDREPLQIRSLIVWYNFAQVIFSMWIFYEYGMSGWFRGYSFTCQPVDYSRSEMAVRMAHACWWYFFSKFTEFLDTIFFVLRKKNEHLSLLHVVHHGCMPMSVWFGVKFTPGGHSTFFGLLNTFVHIVMYTYYMLSAMGPKYQKYIWWKKYLTTLQMVQFVGIITHAFQLLFIDCNYPRAFVWWIGGHALLFFWLFSDFYKKAYKKKEKVKVELRKAVGNGVTKMPNGYVMNGHANGYTNGDLRHRTTANGSIGSKLDDFSAINGFTSVRNRSHENGHVAADNAHIHNPRVQPDADD